jgi:long-chain acyl-CoA synthetase
MDPVAVHASSRPDHPAIVSPGSTRTYRALDDRANRLANLLASRGVAPGERIAVMLPNGSQWFEANVATARLGAQLLPVNWHLLDEEIAWILADSEARVLIAHDSFDEPARGALECVPECAAVWVGDGYEALLDAADPTPVANSETAAPALLLYTSGTTGRPKGVVHEQTTTARSRESHVDLWGFTADDVHALVAPAYHGAPWSYAVTHLSLGATVVAMERWNARQFLELVARHRVTNTFMVPTQLARLLEIPDEERVRWDLSSLRLLLHGGAACPPRLKGRILDALPNVAIWEFYGFSEGGRVTRIGPDEWRAHPGSVGRPLPGVHVEIVSDDGTEAPPGVTGTIYVVPASAEHFYYRNDPEATAAITRATRFGLGVTGGDLGHLDPDGYLYVTDRSVDLVVRGGVNVYPREIENALFRHPAVFDCAAFGVPDPTLGERLVALVEPVSGSNVTGSELESHCRRVLARFKCPEVLLTDCLPRDPNGKIRKLLLRSAARAELPSDAE